MKRGKILAYAANIGRREKIQSFLVGVYALALGTVSLFLTLVLYSFIGEIPPILCFFPAVALSSWYGGWKAGIITTIVGVSGVYYFLPHHSIVILVIFAGGAGIISFVIDTCKRTDEVARYKKREKEYAELLMYLQKANEKAQIEVKARDEFLSIASHELKTPLTSVVLQLQTALNNISNVSLANFSVENLLKMLKSAEQQSRRLTKMINDLLNVSLITTGRLELEREEVNLTQVVKEVVDRFSERLEKEQYSLKLQIPEKPIVGRWDKVRVEQVITNLVSNAIKYGRGKPIEVSVSKNGSFAKLIVKDEGIGIPKEHQQRIFGRFQRAVSAAEYKGLGIGLYITHQIVKAHGGKVKISSKAGKGSTFVVELPL